MSNAHPTIRERHKPLFLKAFSRLGKIQPAAKASRISRDRVYDWLKSDPFFRRDFEKARLISKLIPSVTHLRENVWFFYDVAKRFIPHNRHATLLVELGIALSKTEFKKSLTSTGPTLSRTQERSPLPLIVGVASFDGDGDRGLDLGKNGTYT